MRYMPGCVGPPTPKSKHTHTHARAQTHVVRASKGVASPRPGHPKGVLPSPFGLSDAWRIHVGDP